MHNFAKFHHCRIYVTDFRKGAFLCSRLRAALKRPIVNKAITFCGLKFLRHFHFAGFLNNILFSWHFKFGFQRTCYNSRQFNFAVWPKYHNLWHFDCAIVWKSHAMCVSFQYFRNIYNISGKSKKPKSKLKVGLSPSKKNCVICLLESPLKIAKNAFYFILEALFVLKIFKLLSWLFGHVGKTAWLER